MKLDGSGHRAGPGPRGGAGGALEGPPEIEEIAELLVGQLELKAGLQVRGGDAVPSQFLAVVEEDAVGKRLRVVNRGEELRVNEKRPPANFLPGKHDVRVHLLCVRQS